VSAVSDNVGGIEVDFSITTPLVPIVSGGCCSLCYRQRHLQLTVEILCCARQIGHYLTNYVILLANIQSQEILVVVDGPSPFS
jgi:hypothetical protein